MFAGLAHLIPAAAAASPVIRDIPPPTPVNLPCCRPQVSRKRDRNSRRNGRSTKPLPALLQEIVRPTEVKMSHLEALGVHVIPDVSASELIPDPASIPDFAHWESLSREAAYDQNEETRRKLNNGTLSPGAVTYLDRRRELSVPNDAAFRAVRRIPPPAGQSQVRLGNSFEFFRNLEAFGNFWDDTSQPPPSTSDGAEDTTADGDESAEESDSTEKSAGRNPRVSLQQSFFRTAAGTSMPPEYRHNIITSFLKLVAYDFGCNVSAPRTEPRFYLNAPPVSAVGGAQVNPASANTAADRAAASRGHVSYFASGCAFIFRTPITRTEARAGFVEGPVAAVSARHATSFGPPKSSASASAPSSLPSSSSAPNGISATTVTNPTRPSSTDRDSLIDLSRELVAALLTAQHRRREGRQERRVGEGAWWATRPRWGGGAGGPIGREIDLLSSGGEDVVGDKDEIPSENRDAGPAGSGTPASSGASSSSSAPSSNTAAGTISSRIGGATTTSVSGSSSSTTTTTTTKSDVPIMRPPSQSGPPASKKVRRNLVFYDNYRTLRPPSPAWDGKTRWAALGRRRDPAVDYDDVFLVSALFHHVSIVRVRVPDRLLAVLDGEADEYTAGDREDDGEGGEEEDDEGDEGDDDGAAGGQPGNRSRRWRRSWGRLEMRRSPWYDFFKIEDRVEAMRLVWAMMAYQMRRQDSDRDVSAAVVDGSSDSSGLAGNLKSIKEKAKGMVRHVKGDHDVDVEMDDA